MLCELRVVPRGESPLEVLRAGLVYAMEIFPGLVVPTNLDMEEEGTTAVFRAIMDVWGEMEDTV